MASESRDENAVTVSLPEELGDWLDDRAAALGLGRQELVEQLVAAYRAADDLDSDLDLADALGIDPENLVDEAVTGQIDEIVRQSVEEQLDDALRAAIEERLDERIDSVESEFQTKIEDVRERVVQVKRETDAKAPADHDHEAFGRIDGLEAEIENLTGEIEQLRSDLEAADSDEDLAADIEDIREKLTRIAWVVSDLRDERGPDASERAVARIKRAAAQEGIEEATCESCGGTVRVGLLTDPECPHCDTIVSDVRPEKGIFRTRARLVTASQLEGRDDG
ncbi:MAG: hypothetical protein ABEH35_06310 [Haloarculaceae archaeon]